MKNYLKTVAFVTIVISLFIGIISGWVYLAGVVWHLHPFLFGSITVVVMILISSYFMMKDQENQEY